MIRHPLRRISHPGVCAQTSENVINRKVSRIYSSILKHVRKINKSKVPPNPNFSIPIAETNGTTKEKCSGRVIMSSVDEPSFVFPPHVSFLRCASQPLTGPRLPERIKKLLGILKENKTPVKK
jgi:hypothetical protein